MMIGLRIACFVLFLFYSEISTVVMGDEMIQMLRKKMTGLEDSLFMDIKFLRQDIKRNTDEFRRLESIIEDTRAAIDGNPELNREANKELESQTKQSDITLRLELANRRLRGAFAEEKAVLRKVTSRVKSEIDDLAKEIKDAIGDFKVSHVMTNNEFHENFDSLKTDLTQGLDQFMADLRTNLTSSVDTMSRDIAKETNKAVSTMEKVVSDMKDTVGDTSSRLNELSKKMELFDAKFREMNAAILFQRKISPMPNIFGNDKVRLVNVRSIENTIGGRLEVNDPHHGYWMTVCGRWGARIGTAKVACRMLGFSDAHSFQKGAYGQGTGRRSFYDTCSGSESSLFRCGNGYHPCDHSEDVGIRCKF